MAPIIGQYVYLPVKCRSYDPRAPQVAKLLSSIISDGLAGVSVEHIGSTAVPGCAGKGIIDIMVIYRGAQLQAVKDYLAALGFQHQSVGFIWPEDRPMRVGSINFDGSSFRIHAHVLAEDAPEVAKLRAFRQRLRTDPRLAAAYVAHKQAIVGSAVADPADYTRLKGEFIERVLSPSEQTNSLGSAPDPQM